MTVAAFPETDARLSETARCARMTALRIDGAPPEPPTADMQVYFYRGHAYEQILRARLIEGYGAEDVEWQRTVKWPLGVGHADFYVRSEKQLIEVTSTTSPSAKMLDFKIEQLKQYIHYDPEAEHGAVYVIDSSRLADGERVIPVLLTDEDVERITERVARLQGGEPPERVCARPSQARGMLCPFAAACFEGWQPTPPEQLSEQLDGLVLDAARCEQSYEAAKKSLKESKNERDQARRMVREYLEPGRDYLSGDGITVRVTDVPDGFTYDTPTAIKAGAIRESVMADYTKPKKGYERWNWTIPDNVRKALTPAPDPDYDGPPF